RSSRGRVDHPHKHTWKKCVECDMRSGMMRTSTCGVLVAAAVIAGTLAGCGDDDNSSSVVSGPTSSATPAPTPTSGPPVCALQAGALHDETLPAGTPRGAQIPIEHIIVLMQENRSFDSYFGKLPAAGHTGVDGLPAGASNPDANQKPVPAFHQVPYCT